ncbi:TPA: branched-chain amino acid ABC transporter permease [Vibrio parahaemolyticus]|uniref:branched-chain amino acid ABC transporter permease n=1 Tax=Vibrio TaxID=662 RepID=UPI00193D9170|nr:branched-chain amino acid ABC transporter permease [Vibrio parahaemolyticus]BDP37476.1 branched-chain amino acid ABC transporter permease [Vibrio alginolyticus]MBM4997544.1 branched-chain amino acid ABC transporter permease [Vibrio parahaemolyticus]MCR9695135.1 branched-chain amino acid ABC transporter permease [Vibrio parahaemolyticus]MCR9760070.1 branched-chain amino acid ABC transporter permease [Vibrio parahaemolyticus]MDF4935476.1 branched-chain amino acid ABC transporter permease [Vib
MAQLSMRPCGDFRTTYKSDTPIFETKTIRRLAIAGVIAMLAAPLVLDIYFLNLFIQIAYLGIAALGLNILVGFTGQISLGHGAFFGFGAFASAWLNNQYNIPVVLAIPLAGYLTMIVGMIFGLPAARIKGLYLAIATLAAQFILEDFFARAEWFSGGSYGASASPINLFGFEFSTDESFFYVALFALIFMYLWASNLIRSRDGRAFVSVRDHYLSAEIMGINLTKYRLLSFGVCAFYAGIGGALYGHYLGFVSAEGFTIMMSIQFLAMIIIGGLGSVKGTLMGTIFIVLLPEVLEFGVTGLAAFSDNTSFIDGLAYFKEMAIGLVIMLFLIFEPQGLSHRWQQIRAYWKHYPFSY